MDSDLKNEDILLQLRSKLNQNKIKLWELPYYDENSGPVNKEIETLASKYCTELGMEVSLVFKSLLDLQAHALQKVKANSAFKETGLASLRLKIPPKADGTKVINVEIKLDALGKTILSNVASELQVEDIRIKLINQGRIIKPDCTLAEQGIKNGAQILVVMIAGSPTTLRKEAEMYKEMEHVKSDAQLLSESQDNEHHMMLEDQSGNMLQLPAKEEKALLVAIALHHRAQTILKEGDAQRALVLLLESDQHFSECSADILQKVDNYALLNLDIAWCYLCLQSITHIPDAEARLRLCEKNFHSSYGENLERLIALKGVSGKEKALFMRLHLLQAVVLYHQNKRPEARVVLERAERELKTLKVDESALGVVMALGYGEGEARRGLRDAAGDVDGAICRIMDARRQREEIRLKAKEDWECRALGKCKDDTQFVSVRFVKLLVEMGYDKSTAILALKNSNNHVSNAIQIIQEQPELLNEKDLPKSEMIRKHKDLVRKLVDLGYNSDMALAALETTNFELEQADKLLLQAKSFSTEGIFSVDGASSSMASSNSCPSNACNSASSSSSHDYKAKVKKMEEKHKKKNEIKAAFERLSAGLNVEDDENFDLPLTQEEAFLNQYKALLN